MRSGYLEASASWAPSAGLTGRLEAGYRPLETLGLFGFAEVNTVTGPLAGVGARWIF